MSAIEEKAALLDLLFQATLDGIVDWDVRNNSATYNERWRFLLGYDNDELNPTPTTWRELVHPQEREALEQALSDHLHESWPFAQSVRMRHRATGWRWISIQGTSRRGKDGKVERMALVLPTSKRGFKRKAKSALSSRRFPTRSYAWPLG